MSLAPKPEQDQLPFLFEGNRDEVSNVSLKAIKGTIPQDLHGHLYLMTQCGTVNSGGYPFPKEVDGESNSEYGSPVLNGNGMMFYFDLTQTGKVTASSKIVKSPSFYADYALRDGGPAREEEDFKHWKFYNMGITRMSLFLGPVNYANTAIIPVKFKNDSGESILATYDTGRPLKHDPLSLEFITPLGYNNEWRSGFPRFLQEPLPMFESTAHPSWDPNEQVLYSVNFTKSIETELSRSIIFELLRHDKKFLIEELTKIAVDYKEHKSAEKAIDEINKIIENRKSIKAKPKKKKGGFWNWLKNLLFGWIEKDTETEDSVTLVRFDGENIKTWKLLDEKGDELRIFQCMHQTSITQDYLVLMDSSFKFSFDILVNNPFPDVPIIDELLRTISAKTILPSTKVWVVRKSDLAQGDTVTAYAVQGQPIEGLSNEPYGGIPMECVHFSAEFDNPNDQITIYTAHNNNTCLAEWVRSYDVNYYTKAPYTETDISNYAVGQLSLSSVGKYVIDGKTMSFVPGANSVIREKGNLPPVSDLKNEPLTNVGPNTWGIGLYGYRNMIDPVKAQGKIDQLFFVSFGTQPALLTQFIYDLYADQTQNREMPLEDVVAYTKCGIPQSLISVSTEDMSIEEHFEFEWGTYPMSVQFVPLPVPTPGRAPGKDGYVWIVGKSLIQENGKYKYQSQVYIFEAWNIAQGPVCVLAADNFNPCTCLHVAWMENADKVSSGYMVDIVKDFNQSIEDSFLEIIEKEKYQAFFDKYVYPNFKS